MYELEFSIGVREHVVNTLYVLPVGMPMILLVRDERKSNQAVLTGIGAVLGRGVDPRFLATPTELRSSTTDGHVSRIAVNQNSSGQSSPRKNTRSPPFPRFTA